MPASRSPRTDTERGLRSWIWLTLAGLVAAAGFLLFNLPAALALKFLPGDLQASGPSGTLWHGSISNLSSRGRDMGALEWHVHPWPLLTGRLSAAVHWVRQDISVNSEIAASRSRLNAHDMNGGGPLSSLADLGLTRGWNGKLEIDIGQFTLSAGRILAATGEARLLGLHSTEFPGADFGNVVLAFGPGSVQEDGTAIAQLHDTQGILQLEGNLTLALGQHLATFSGTLKERSPLPPALAQRIAELAQMRGRDPQGRIPFDIEFAL